MKNQIFLKKLYKEKKIQLVEPSEDIKLSYQEKSESNILSAKLLFDNDKLEEAVALCYYSMYNGVIALLFKTGIKCENHTGTIILLKELFDIDNSELGLAKKERIDKQYYTDFQVSKKEVEEMVKIAEIFNDKIIDFISKLNTQTIENYREKFKFIIKK